MVSPLRYLGQAAIFVVFAAVIGFFADSPAYTRFPPDQALIKLSLAHGARKENCRERTPEELAKLPANMRRPLACTRERLPVVVELLLNDAQLYHAVLPPSGLAGDGPSRTYERFTVPPGEHTLVARLRDSDRADGFDFERRFDLDLVPGQSVAIDFRAETGGFILR